jgi:hypothetical protein
MKKIKWILFFLIIAPNILPAYENCMPNLDVPSALEAGQMRFSIQHRFYGRVDDKPGETFFGVFGYGANTALGLKAAIGKGFMASGMYISEGKETQLGLSWDFSITKWLLSQVGVKYFSFRPTWNVRESSVFCEWVLQSKALMKRITPVFNLAYDGYYKALGCGAGVSVDVLDNVGLMAELYPGIENGGASTKTSYFVGAKIRTYGHYFIFVLGNSYYIGTRRLMRGASDNYLHLGFTIQRLLEL